MTSKNFQHINRHSVCLVLLFSARYSHSPISSPVTAVSLIYCIWSIIVDYSRPWIVSSVLATLYCTQYTSCTSPMLTTVLYPVYQLYLSNANYCRSSWKLLASWRVRRVTCRELRIQQTSHSGGIQVPFSVQRRGFNRFLYLTLSEWALRKHRNTLQAKSENTILCYCEFVSLLLYRGYRHSDVALCDAETASVSSCWDNVVDTRDVLDFSLQHFPWILKFVFWSDTILHLWILWIKYIL